MGFANHEALAGQTGSQYPSVVDQLAAQGLVAVKAFSLYLNDRGAAAGSILFGGLDTDMFIGRLAVVPIIADGQTRSISTYTVALTRVAAANASAPAANASYPSPAAPVPALLDSGTTLTFLPDRTCAASCPPSAPSPTTSTPA